MAVFFFDSSAIIKRYANEIGSAWVTGITQPAAANLIYLARITKVEVVSAITRRTRSGQISASDATTGLTAFEYDFIHHYRIIEITPALVDRAALIAHTHALRGYDAVQLAATLQVNSDRLSLRMSTVTLVSADAALNAAAVAEGLVVDDPNSHP